MTNGAPETTRKGKYSSLTLPIIVATVVLVVLASTAGWFWLGWPDIVQNRRILSSLPMPPDTQRTYIGSNGYSKDDSVITPPERWSTLAEFEFQNHTREYLAEFYISRMSPEWEHCTRDISDGVWFVRGDSVVGLDTQSAPSTQGTGSFEIHVVHNDSQDPCGK